MELRDIIKQYRTDHNLTQRKFADRCTDITHGYISMIERNLNKSTGKPPRPSVEKLESIARGMNMTYEQLHAMMNDKPVPDAPGVAPEKARPVLIHMPEPETINQKIIDLIESEVQSRMDEQMKGKAEPIDDPDDWIPLAPGFNQMAPQFQRDFKAAVANVWKLYHDLSNQQRKDEPQ